MQGTREKHKWLGAGQGVTFLYRNAAQADQAVLLQKTPPLSSKCPNATHTWKYLDSCHQVLTGLCKKNLKKRPKTQN